MKTLHSCRSALFLIPFSLSLAGNSQNVAINTTGVAADPSALLDVKSTTAGVLIPRMTTAQRNAISSPALGLQVFNTDCDVLNYWTGTCWVSAGAIPAPDSIFSGASTVLCTGATATYTIPAVTGATSYYWSVPPGASITSPRGSTSISVKYGSYSGNVCVTANDACETSQPTCRQVSVISPIVASAGSNLQYYSSSCSAVTIGGSPTGSGGTSTYAYSWSPATGLSSSTIANPTANPTSTTIYTVTVSSGGCSATSSMTFSLATGGSQTFTYTGTPQTWIVPAGVTCISITAMGASGGAAYNSGITGPGGLGGTVSGIKLVTPGSVLTINVGQQGGNASSTATNLGGINGGGNGGYEGASYSGGGGGGASDVMIGGTALSNRIIVAAGGGGGGPGATNSNGGSGGYPFGGNGLASGSYTVSNCGVGGTVFSGGAGGSNSPLGIAGGLGYGGASGSLCAGGGGGGYYGGGGGGGGCYSGGGGGGASYIGGMSSNTSNTNGNNSGNGQVTISW